MIHLDNGTAKATILPARGGLLSSLTMTDGRGGQHDILWMPRDFATSESGWPGGGLPVCFPFAGRVFHDGFPFQYETGGIVRTMPIHGFAYGLPWTVSSQAPATVTLTLDDSATTHQLFPFRFHLAATYALGEQALAVTLTTRHVSPLSTSERMPVAAGLHPYFRMPLTGGPLSACRLETSASRQHRVTPTGAAGKAETFPSDDVERRGNLAEGPFANLILGSHAQPRASLIDDTIRLAIDVGWDAASVDYLVLWSKRGEGFHCLEPWMGLPDAVNNGQGVAWLAAGEELTLRFTIGLRSL